MSGPTTLEFLLIQGTILGTRAVLRSARDAHHGLQEARLADEQALSLRSESDRAMKERERAAARGLDRRIEMLEAGLRRLATLAEALRPTLAAAGSELVVTLPKAPAERTPVALAQHADALEATLTQAQDALSAAGAQLASHSDAVDAAVLARLARPRSLADLLDAYAEAGRQDRDAARSAARRAQVDKLVAPSAEEGGISPAVEALVRELAGAPNEARADALLLELRHALAAERARRDAEARQRAAAEALLAELDAFECADADLAALRQTLELAAAGLANLDDELTARARSMLAALREAAAEATRAAAAHVLESALHDLGFVVEPIAETLFVEGGVTHFSRAEWGDYAVRVRASPADGTLNFNVVREAKAAAGDTVSTRLRDMRAEEAWCAHIPKLQRTLDERGMRLKVLRRLGAGEAPAQVVAAGTLDALGAATASRAGGAPAAEAPAWRLP